MVYFNIFQVHFIQTIIHFTVLVITNQVLIFHDLKIRLKNLSGMSKRLVIRWSLARFPWSACRKVLGQDTEPHTAPDVLVCSLHGSYHHQCMNVRMNYCKSLWTKASAKCPQCKCRRVCLQQPYSVALIIHVNTARWLASHYCFVSTSNIIDFLHQRYIDKVSQKHHVFRIFSPAIQHVSCVNYIADQDQHAPNKVLTTTRIYKFVQNKRSHHNRGQRRDDNGDCLSPSAEHVM